MSNSSHVCYPGCGCTRVVNDGFPIGSSHRSSGDSYTGNCGNRYKASYYINGQFTEEFIYAQQESHARNIIEARYAGVRDSRGNPQSAFRWSRTPQLA